MKPLKQLSKRILPVLLLVNMLTAESCTPTLLDEVNDDIPVGGSLQPISRSISDDLSQPSISIEDKILVVCGLPKCQYTVICLYDRNGCVMCTWNSINKDSVAIPLDGYPSGRYTVLICIKDREPLLESFNMSTEKKAN